jgi:hypothetical protein
LGVPEEDSHGSIFDYTPWVLPEDIPSVEKNFNLLMVDHQSVKHEFRLVRTWHTPSDEETPMWVSATSTPIFHPETGKISTCQGILTDISSLKWAESIQMTKLGEAVEAKRQQERFIDVSGSQLYRMTLLTKNR